MTAPVVSSASPARGDPAGKSRSSTSMGVAVSSLHHAHIKTKHTTAETRSKTAGLVMDLLGGKRLALENQSSSFLRRGRRH